MTGGNGVGSRVGPYLSFHVQPETNKTGVSSRSKGGYNDDENDEYDEQQKRRNRKV